MEFITRQPALLPAIRWAQSFAKIVRERLSNQLDSWLGESINSLVQTFQNFAKSLKEDYDAVKASVTLEISNGQVEGQIHRLKTLKRQMYG